MRPQLFPAAAVLALCGGQVRGQTCGSDFAGSCSALNGIPAGGACSTTPNSPADTVCEVYEQADGTNGCHRIAGRGGCSYVAPVAPAETPCGCGTNAVGCTPEECCTHPTCASSWVSCASHPLGNTLAGDPARITCAGLQCTQWECCTTPGPPAPPPPPPPPPQAAPAPPPPPPPPPPCPGMWHPCTSNCEGGPGCADHIDDVYGLTCAEAAEYGCVSDLWRFSCAAGAADCIDADIPHYTYVVELCPRTCGECDRTYGEYHVNEDGLLTDIWDEIAPVPSCAPEPLDCREEPKDADNNHCEVPDVCEAADCTEPFTKLKDSPDECQGGACTAAECCTAFECTDAADAARQGYKANPAATTVDGLGALACQTGVKTATGGGFIGAAAGVDVSCPVDGGSFVWSGCTEAMDCDGERALSHGPTCEAVGAAQCLGPEDDPGKLDCISTADLSTPDACEDANFWRECRYVESTQLDDDIPLCKAQASSEAACLAVVTSDTGASSFRPARCEYCPWRNPTPTPNVMACMDGSYCNTEEQGWSCCSTRGGRAQCPSNYPNMCDSRECAGGTDYCCEIDCTQWSGFRTDGDWRPPMANRPCPLGDQCPSEECTGSTAADCGGGCTFIPAGSDPACVYTAGHDQQRLGLAAGEDGEAALPDNVIDKNCAALNAEGRLKHGERCEVQCKEGWSLVESQVNEDGRRIKNPEFFRPLQPRCDNGVFRFAVSCEKDTEWFWPVLIVVVLVAVLLLWPSAMLAKEWLYFKTEKEKGFRWDAAGDKLMSDGKMVGWEDVDKDEEEPEEEDEDEDEEEGTEDMLVTNPLGDE